MKINLSFTQITGTPSCKVLLNGNEVFSGVVQAELEVITKLKGNITLEISTQENTVFELKKVIIDDQSLDEVLWDLGYFVSLNGDVNPGCLYFCQPGKVVINIENPILPWLLRNKHKKYNNDPGWEEDYAYYEKACQILNQIPN